LRTDKIVELTVPKSKRLYPEKLRLVEFTEILSTSLFDKTPLQELLNADNKFQIKQNQNVKELLLFEC
jgi:hypothetical protein